MLKAGASEDKGTFWGPICSFLIVSLVLVVQAYGGDTDGPKPVVAFDVGSGRGMEGILPVEIPVSLSVASQHTVTVDYEVTSGTAIRAADFALPPATLTFSPGQTKKHITLSIVQDDVQEPDETIVLTLSNPTNAKLAGKSSYTYTIIEPDNFHLKVDFGLPIWSGPDNERGSDKPVPGTIKQGWTPWVSPRWADMYDHGAVQLENVAATGINMMVSTVRGGHMTLKVCGLIGHLAGGLPPSGSPDHGPICNSWLYNCDWPDNPWGDIILAVYNLPAGEYLLKSYHNHFNCIRVPGTDDPTLIDCSAAENPQPPMPSIRALSLAELLKRYRGTDRWDGEETEFVNARPEYWDYHGQEDFPPKRPLGPHGSGAVTTLHTAHNVQPQQVTRDKDLMPSVMKFRTDGSSVHIVYQAGCCVHDGVRPSRDGGRAILNAFELIYVRKTDVQRSPRVTRPYKAVSKATMTKIYEQIKTPYKYGIILKGKAGEKVDCPSVFRHKEKWYMVYIIFDGSGYETAIAQSIDLINWKKLGKILKFKKEKTWDCTQVAGYIALQDHNWGGSYKLQEYDEKYWLSYIGGALKGYETGPLAIGIAWTKNPTKPLEWNRIKENPILHPYQPDAREFETKKLYKSNIIWDKDQSLGYPFVMFYNAKHKPTGVERIGMAVSNDMIHWKRFGDKPVIDNFKGISGDPQITKIGDVWVMFYFGAFWKPKAFDTFACSYDLVNWTKWDGPDLIGPSEPWDKKYAHKPWMIKHRDIVYHFYCAVGDQGRAIALATSKPLKP